MNENPLTRFRGLSRPARLLTYAILAGMIGVGLYAFFSSRIGQYALVCCIAAPVVLIVVGLFSERGMRR